MREREGNLIKDVLTGRCSLQSYFLFCFCVCWKETQSWINKNKLSSFNGHGCCKGVTEPPILSLLPTSLLLKWQCSSGMYFIFIFYPYNSISTQVTTAERTVHSRWPLGRLSALGSCSHVLGKKDHQMRFCNKLGLCFPGCPSRQPAPSELPRGVGDAWAPIYPVVQETLSLGL